MTLIKSGFRDQTTQACGSHLAPNSVFPNDIQTVIKPAVHSNQTQKHIRSVELLDGDAKPLRFKVRHIPHHLSPGPIRTVIKHFGFSSHLPPFNLNLN